MLVGYDISSPRVSCSSKPPRCLAVGVPLGGLQTRDLADTPVRECYLVNYRLGIMADANVPSSVLLTVVIICLQMYYM